MLFRQIEAFRALMLTQTEVGAAEMLGVSQPAVSRIISRLEGELQLTLFDRGNGRLTPTEEARILYKEVDTLARSMERVKQLAADLRAVKTGDLRIAAMPALALSFIPRVLAKFSQQFPDLTVKFEMLPSDEIEQLVAAQLVDLGVVELPVRRSGVSSEIFCNRPQVLIVPCGHPLTLKAVARPSDLADCTLITTRCAKTNIRPIDHLLERENVKVRAVVDTKTMTLVSQMVSNGLGAGLVDQFTAINIRPHGVIAIPFEPSIDFVVGIVFPTHKLLSKPTRYFLKTLREERNAYLCSSN